MREQEKIIINNTLNIIDHNITNKIINQLLSNY
jgi:hypothetical protein